MSKPASFKMAKPASVIGSDKRTFIGGVYIDEWLFLSANQVESRSCFEPFDLSIIIRVIAKNIIC